MRKIRLKLDKKRSYDIVIGYNIMPRLTSSFIEKLRLGKDALIITNPAIDKRYRKIILRGLKPSKYNTKILTIPGTEKSKSNTQVVRLIERIVKIDRGRGIFIVAFGGGMTGDVAGFAASIYKRGVPYIQIPTTLLAQVDSAIGGKTAIDLAAAKNLVGAFYQPRLVVSDIKFLEGLPLRIFKSGLGEVIKYGIIQDRRLFEFLEKKMASILKRNADSLEEIISRSSRIKAEIVQKDEYDTKGVRAILNYGHTVGHALEAASGYSSKLYYHGEAIAIGMVAAAKIAAKMEILKGRHLRRIIGLIKKAGLPVKISKRLKINRIIEAQLYDKKIIHGVNRFVLPTKIGKVKIYENVSRKIVYDVIKDMRKGG